MANFASFFGISQLLCQVVSEKVLGSLSSNDDGAEDDA